MSIINLLKTRPAVWLMLILIFLSRGTARPQDLPRPALASAQPYFADIFQKSGATGMVVVVVRDGETWFESYGQTYPGSHQKPNAESLVRLCSLTKIMTSDLLVKMIAEKRVSLDDPLQKFAPHGAMVPERTVRGEPVRAITLRDLATHTAGLPREIAYPAGDAAHFTFPDYSFRWNWLPGWRLRTPPGYAAHYSNIGFDFLADALSAAAKEPYPRLFAERVSRPLGLRDTTLNPTPGECARLMLAAKNGGACSDTSAAGGSGGMYSTPSDMARWLKYLLALPGVPMHQDPAATATYIPASQLRWTQGMARAGVPTGIGLGWVHINDPADPTAIIEKTGGGAGYNTYIALNPGRHIGLFVAATDGRHQGPSIFGASNDLLIYLAGLAPEAAPQERPEVAAHDTTLRGHRKKSRTPSAIMPPLRPTSIASGQ